MAHHATARVFDIKRAINWYRDVLGFRVLDQGERENGAFRYADLGIPGFGIGLVQTSGPSADLPPGTGLRHAWLHVVFSVADPQALYLKLQHHGEHLALRAGQSTTPVQSFLLYDSEGNELEIIAASIRESAPARPSVN